MKVFARSSEGREVVSRHLKSLECEGLIETQRGKITVLRRKTLEALR